jgi:hypothetical protein
MDVTRPSMPSGAGRDDKVGDDNRGRPIEIKASKLVGAGDLFAAPGEEGRQDPGIDALLHESG